MTAKRPPHRPSRRAAVVEAAMSLFASRPPEEVTVSDIAVRADMTAAAVYYHFPSKEHVLLEGLQQFTDELLTAMTALTTSVDGDDWVDALIIGLLEWVEQHAIRATVYFVHSAGVDAAIEALRRETRIAQVDLLAQAIRQRTGTRRTSVDPEVAAIGLISLLETGSSSWLMQDDVFLDLGRRRFLAEMSTLATRLVGPPVSASA